MKCLKAAKTASLFKLQNFKWVTTSLINLLCHHLETFRDPFSLLATQRYIFVGLMVEATCQDVGAYVGMVDPLEVVCTCPTGMEGDGHFCEDTDPCDGANNPCYDISTCSVSKS